MDELKVMIFGQLEDVTGASAVNIPAAADTDALCNALYQQYPSLKERKFVIAVDQKIVKGNTIIHKGAQVALLPPFSGG